MRGPSKISAAFRLPDQTIVTQTEELPSIYRAKIFLLPFLRGLSLLWDALVLGYRYLMISANHQVKEEEKIDNKSFYPSLLLSLLIAIGIFIVLPGILGKWIGEAFSWRPIFRNLFEGVLRLGLLIIYLLIIGKNKDISRVFQYHGAEHKTINAYESGIKLTPKNLATVSKYHPRCGSSFTLSFVIVSIIVFSFLGDLPILWIILSRILLLPLIAMVAYEYIRFLGNYPHSRLIRFLSLPNLWIQNLTTFEPTQAMLEVAISAFSGLENKS